VEKAGDVGGTWYWNRYPGVQCDVDSYVYLPLLEETGYIPSRKYAYGEEIYAHAQRIARHFGLYEGALFQTQVTSAVWDPTRSRWRIGTDRGDELAVRHLVISNGTLSRAKLPGIPGINDFAGHTFHTSRWDYDYTGGHPTGGDSTGPLDRLADKRVGIIGTGATAIQAVPHLARSAREVFVFQRTPSVVGVRNNQLTDPGWAASLSPGWQQHRMDNFTRVVYGQEADLDLVSDGWTELQKSISATAALRVERRLGRALTADERSAAVELSDLRLGDALRARVSDVITDPQTAERLKAWYYLYCKRPTFSDDYLPAFNRPNVHLVQTSGSGVDSLSENAVVVDGTHYEVDCLIFASGFEVATSFASQAGFDPVGLQGRTLEEKWAEGPRTLHGLMSNGFPNLFLMGIVQNASTLNFTHMLDQQAQHIAHIVGRLEAGGQLTAHPSVEAEKLWLEEMLTHASEPERQRWQRCTPSYLNSDGDVDNAFGFFARRYAGGPVRFFSLLADWRANGQLEGLEPA
jgi:cation diffusion facilitator CzcD-associated flavoprotein CzcO